MVRIRAQKALYSTGTLFTKKMTAKLTVLGVNGNIQQYLRDITNNVLESFINTPIDDLKDFDYDQLTETYVPSAISIFRQNEVLKKYVLKNIDVLLKSKLIVRDLENFKEQLEGIQKLKEKYKKQLEAEGAGDMILPVTLETSVTVSLSTKYLLYQHLFGYPQNGIWDQEKLLLIEEALQQTGIQNNNGNQANNKTSTNK